MPSLADWLQLSKLARLARIIKWNGGLRKSIYTVYRMDDLKIGTLVGTDKYGNKYYENNEFFHGRNRWVVFTDDAHLDYDASQIPAEWHPWIHYTTDIPPTVKPPVQYKWMVDHTPNYTGSPLSYVPYSTTREKIQSWNKQLPQTDVKQLK